MIASISKCSKCFPNICGVIDIHIDDSLCPRKIATANCDHNVLVRLRRDAFEVGGVVGTQRADATLPLLLRRRGRCLWSDVVLSARHRSTTNADGRCVSRDVGLFAILFAALDRSTMLNVSQIKYSVSIGFQMKISVYRPVMHFKLCALCNEYLITTHVN